MSRLHAFQGIDAEEFESGDEDGTGACTEEESACPHIGFFDHDFVGIVEAAVGTGEFVQISAEEVGA